MISVLLHPTGVLVIRGEPGGKDTGSHTLSALSRLGCGTRTGCGKGALPCPLLEVPLCSPLHSMAQSGC